jgi:hypothetical protein
VGVGRTPCGGPGSTDLIARSGSRSATSPQARRGRRAVAGAPQRRPDWLGGQVRTGRRTVASTHAAVNRTFQRRGNGCAAGASAGLRYAVVDHFGSNVVRTPPVAPHAAAAARSAARRATRISPDDRPGPRPRPGRERGTRSRGVARADGRRRPPRPGAGELRDRVTPAVQRCGRRHRRRRSAAGGRRKPITAERRRQSDHIVRSRRNLTLPIGSGMAMRQGHRSGRGHNREIILAGAVADTEMRENRDGEWDPAGVKETRTGRPATRRSRRRHLTTRGEERVTRSRRSRVE